MKEASGELSMTLVTIIAVAAIIGIITFLLPGIRKTIQKRWENTDTTIKSNDNGQTFTTDND